MNSIFEPQLRKFILVFFDEILVYSKTLEEHLVHLNATLSMLQQHHLFARREKYFFWQNQNEYLGYVITGQEV